MHTKSIRNWAFAGLVAGMCMVISSAPGRASEVALFHVHGLGYSADGKALYVPSHYGIAIYEKGRWRKADGPEHDYMGFSATRTAFYSSGHPAEGSGMINPFGLLKSTDRGKTWKKLGMEGESDFHVLAASYNTNAIYLFNNAPNSRIPVTGLAYTLDDGVIWQQANQEGAPQPDVLAVHPTQPKHLAIGAEGGLYLSTDAGDHFSQAVKGVNVYGVWFDLNGTEVWYGGTTLIPHLARLDLKTNQVTQITLPPMGRDAIAYIAQNPARRDEFAIATFSRSIFVTTDRGKNWRPIARDGATQ